MCLTAKFFTPEAQREREQFYASATPEEIAKELVYVGSTVYLVATEMAAWLTLHRPQVLAKLSPVAQLHYHLAMVKELENQLSADDAVTAPTRHPGG